MSYMPENFADYIPALLKLPKGVYFGVNDKEIDCQAQKQEDVKKVRECFPGVMWKKEYKKDFKWWEYKGKYNGIQIKIYNVREAPQTCKAITEKRTIERKVATQWTTKMVEEEVIVGYDCGPENGEDNAESPTQEGA